MKKYRALVIDNKKFIYIESEYKNKKMFADDLRRNGYKVRAIAKI